MHQSERSRIMEVMRSLTPARDPFDVLAGVDGIVLESINRAEPLLRGTEDDRVLAAPAVRIAVNDVLGCEQCAAVIQILENDLIGVLYEHALILAGFSRCDGPCRQPER